MDPNMFELGISGKPFLRPEMVWVTCFAPRLPRTTTETMDEDKLEQWRGRRIKYIETKGTDNVF